MLFDYSSKLLVTRHRKSFELHDFTIQSISLAKGTRYPEKRTLVEMDWLFLLCGLLIRQCLSCLTTSVRLSLAQCHAQAALALHSPRPVGVLVFGRGSIYHVGSHWSPCWWHWALDLRQWQPAQMNSRFCGYLHGTKESICYFGSPW